MGQGSGGIMSVSHRYSGWLGKRVEVHYRSAGMQLSVTGILASDSGKFLYLEDGPSAGDGRKTLRVAIPCACVLRVEEVPDSPGAAPPRPPPGKR